MLIAASLLRYSYKQADFGQKKNTIVETTVSFSAYHGVLVNSNVVKGGKTDPATLKTA